MSLSVRLRWPLFAAAHAAAGLWLARPGWGAAGAAVVLLVLAGLTMLRTTGLRAALVAGVLAVEAAALALSQVRIAEIRDHWPRTREARILAARDRLEESLRDARRRTEQIADRAKAVAELSPEEALAALPDLLPDEDEDVESGVAILDANGSALAWAGRHRLPPEAEGDSIGMRATSYHAILESRRHLPNGRVVVANALLAADRAVPDEARSVARRFEELTEVGLQFFLPGRAPDTPDVFDYVQPTTTGSDTLFSTMLMPPEQQQALERAGDRGAGRVAWLVVMALLTGALLAQGVGARLLLVAAPLPLLLLTPFGPALGNSALFRPELYAHTVLGPISASAGTLIYGTGLMAVAGVALLARFSGQRWWGVVPAALLILAAPYLMSQLSRGVRPPSQGVPTSLWLIWEVGLYLASFAIIVLAAALLPRHQPRRVSSWLAGIAAALGMAAAVVGLVVWNARFGWPDWYPFLWTLPLGLVAWSARTRFFLLAASLVAGSAAALLTWGAEVGGRVEAARADLAVLGRGPDSATVAVTERFLRDIGRRPTPPEGASGLFAAWRESVLGRSGRPVSLGLWRRDGSRLAALPLYQMEIADSFVERLVTRLDAARPTRLDTVPGVPGPYLVGATAVDSTAVVSVIVGPPTSLLKPSRLGRLLVRDRLSEPLYQLALAPARATGPPREGVALWRREGWYARGERTTAMGAEVRDVTGRVALGAPGGLLIRGVLVLAVDVVVAALLAAIAGWLISRPWHRPPWVPELRSFRSRIAITLGLFFLVPALGFATWNLLRLKSEGREHHDLVIAQILRDAAPSGAVARDPDGDSPSQVLDSLSARVGANLALYRQGRLVGASGGGILEEYGLLSPLVDPEAYHRIAFDGDPSAEVDGPNPALRTRIGFRAVQSPNGESAILASPQLANDPAMAQEARDLVMLVLLSVLLGAGGALLGAQISARTLARPVNELRESALAFGRGEPLTHPAKEPPLEFQPVFAAMDKMASDVQASRESEERAARVLAWGEMASQVAHEIKNPLTPMRLGIQHLLRVYRDGRAPIGTVLEETSQRILTEIDRLDRIARSFSRFGAPRGALSPLEPTDLEEVCREVVDLYGLAPDGVRVTLAVELPGRVMARRDELKETLLNLIENARNAQARTIQVVVSGPVVTVSDDGEGIPSDRLTRVFEPRFSTNTSGAGLGLAIVRRLVESWGAEIEVESELGQGTRMTVRWPNDT